MSSYSPATPPLRVNPRQHVADQIALRLPTKVQVRYAHPLELAGPDLEPGSDLLAGQNCAKRMVTPLL